MVLDLIGWPSPKWWTWPSLQLVGGAVTCRCEWGSHLKGWVGLALQGNGGVVRILVVSNRGASPSLKVPLIK